MITGSTRPHLFVTFVAPETSLQDEIKNEFVDTSPPVTMGRLGKLCWKWFLLAGLLFSQQAAEHFRCVLPFADPWLGGPGVSETSVDSPGLGRRMWSCIRSSWSSVSNPSVSPSSLPAKPFCSCTSWAACGCQLSQDGGGILIVSCCLWDWNASWIKANFGVWSIKCQIWKRTYLRLLCCRRGGHPRPRGRERKKEIGERKEPISSSMYQAISPYTHVSSLFS